MNHLLHPQAPIEEVEYYEDDHYEYAYDDFTKKWLKRRKERRASNPKVIARKERKASKPPRKLFIFRRKPIEKVAPKPTKDLEASKSTRSLVVPNENITPLTKEEAQAHKNTNRAMQEELETKKKELETKELEKKIEKENALKNNIESKTQLAGFGKVVTVIGLLIAGGYVINQMTKKEATQTATP